QLGLFRLGLVGLDAVVARNQDFALGSRIGGAQVGAHPRLRALRVGRQVAADGEDVGAPVGNADRGLLSGPGPLFVVVGSVELFLQPTLAEGFDGRHRRVQRGTAHALAVKQQRRGDLCYFTRVWGILLAAEDDVAGVDAGLGQDAPQGVGAVVG